MMPTTQTLTTARTLRLLQLFRAYLGYRGLAMLFGSSVLLSMIDLLGLAMVFPLLKLVTDLPFHRTVADLFVGTPLANAMQDHKTSVMIFGTVLMVFYIVKGLVHSGLIRYQAKVAGRINAGASQELIGTALNSRYQLFQKHGAVKIASVSYSNTTHAALLLQTFIAAGNEVLLLVLILLSGVILAPWLSLGLFVVMLVLARILFVPFSRRVSSLGRATQLLDLARHRFTFAMATAIRDIKIMGLETAFINRNRSVVEEYAGLVVNYQSLTAALRIAVETILVCGIVVACVSLGYSGQNLEALAPMLGAAVLLVVRIVPATSRLVGSYNGFWYSLPFVEALLEMRDEIAKYPQKREFRPIRFPGELAANNLRFAYDGNQVLSGASLVIPRGGVVAVVGPSGSGKSTLLDLLAGLQPPDAGNFTLDGEEFEPFTSAEFSRKLGYVPQSIALLDATLEFNICLEDAPDRGRLADAIKRAHLDGLVGSLPHGLSTLLGEGKQGVSGGQRQRIGIARALYRSPALLILDEVTSALDTATEFAVMGELLDLRGATSLLFVTHRIDTVIGADAIYYLDGGTLIKQPGHASDVDS